MMLLNIATLLATVALAACGHHQYHHAPGYSYAKFSGPVSGHEQEVIVPHDDHHGHHGHGHAVDYIAKPDYHFAYGVEDPKSKVSQSRKETRIGDTVHGEYSVVDPDGVLRIVKYTADKHNGFQAQIIKSDKGHHSEDASPAHLQHEVHHVEEDGDDHGGDEYY